MKLYIIGIFQLAMFDYQKTTNKKMFLIIDGNLEVQTSRQYGEMESRGGKSQRREEKRRRKKIRERVRGKKTQRER